MRKTAVWVERAIFFSFLAALADPAYAYLDPGTGSVVTTTILGFFGAIAYTARKYIYKVKDLFAGKKRRGAADDEE